MNEYGKLKPVEVTSRKGKRKKMEEMYLTGVHVYGNVYLHILM
jgi:hypothetical protein